MLRERSITAVKKKKTKIMEEVRPPVCQDRKLVAIAKLKKTLYLLEELEISVKENSLVGEISMCISRALNLLDSAGEEPALVPEKMTPVTQDSSAQPKRKNKNGAGGKKNVVRRRTSNPEVYTATRSTLEDGHTWRKYGQKEIHNFSHPRSYYRCTYKHTRDCKATRQAQRSEGNDSIYHITYIGHHTCKDSIKNNHNHNHNHQNDLLVGQEPADLSSFAGSPSSVVLSIPPELISSAQVDPVGKQDVIDTPLERYNLSLSEQEILSVLTTALETAMEDDDEICGSTVEMEKFLEEDLYFNFTDLLNMDHSDV